MRGNAKAVHSVDSSAKAIELTNENIALNFPGDPRHEAFCEDAFKYLDEHDQQYDLIILDPPAFAKHRAALRNALKFRALTGTSMKDLVTTGLAMRKNQDLTWAQLAMAANAPMLTKAAMVDGQAEVGILPTGQVVGVIDSLPAVAEVLDDIVTEAEATLDRLAG